MTVTSTNPGPEANEPPPAAKTRKPRSRTPPPPPTVWARIQEHKVLQWSIAYLGAALAMAHGQELLAHAFHWPEVVGRLLMGALIIGFPIAVVLAWYHGHKRMRHISAGEMTVLAALILAGGAALTIMARSERSGDAPVSTKVSDTESSATATTALAGTKPRLAIMPFANLSPDPNNAFFTDGLHEEILSTLTSRTPDLQVISRTTMTSFKGRPVTVGQLAKELGATYVMEGSVRREGQQVRLTLQLINARDDDHVWAQNYDRTLANALTLQSDVAQEVAAQLSVRFASGAEHSEQGTRNPEAYDYYLKALVERQKIFDLTVSLEHIKAIQELLSRAIELDPLFAMAYADRAAAWILPFTTNIDNSEEPLRRGRKDLETAERLAPNNPTVLAARGWYLLRIEQNAPAAAALLARAQAGGIAGSGWDRLEAEALVISGRLAEGITAYRRALAVNQKDRLLITSFASMLTFYRRPAEALRILDFGIRELPEAEGLKYLRAELIRDYTGHLPPGGAPWNFDELRLDDPRQPPQAVMIALQEMRMAHRDEVSARQCAAASGTTLLRNPVLSAGQMPLADLCGWVAILRGDRVAAAKAGKTVLEFRKHQVETRWNRLSLALLEAHGYAFIGNRSAAVEAARVAARLARESGSVDPLGQVMGQASSVIVLAWNGATDEAVSLLEDLAIATPGLAPALITSDPLIAKPLANNARYQALRTRLEAQMAATKL